jgi:Zn-dependent peptidase ImmA (M78 family)
MAPGARIFTLLHELVHLALASGNEEKPALNERRDESAWSKVESFAEEAASATVIPEKALAMLLDQQHVGAGGWDLATVRNLARRFRVTPLAMATRLRAAGAMSWTQYNHWRSRWAEHVATLKPRAGGPVSPSDMALGRGGRPFAQLVIEAMDLNRITSVQACRYLDLRFEHLEKLRGNLRFSPPSAEAVGDAE